MGAYRGTSWHDSDSEDHEERTEHDDPTHSAPSSDTQATPTLRASSPKRCRKSQTVKPTQSEAESVDEPPELVKDGESSDDDSEHQTSGKISSDPKSSESNLHFDMRPDLSSSDSNPAESNPVTNERNEYYPKYFVDEFENLDDAMIVYIRYRIAGGKMKFRESDTGAEDHYAQSPELELEDIGDCI